MKIHRLLSSLQSQILMVNKHRSFMFNIGEHCNYNNSIPDLQYTVNNLVSGTSFAYTIIARNALWNSLSKSMHVRQTNVCMCLSTLLMHLIVNLILYHRSVVLRTSYCEISLQLFNWGIWCQFDTIFENDMLYGMIFWLSNAFTNLYGWVII